VYDPAEIPEKILTHNLYGIEIDERAGELAAFALTMKARAKQRRFFNKGVKPNICVLENVHFDEGELKSYMDFVGRDLFTAPLQTTLRQFEEADNFGSLIRPDVTDVDGMLRILESKNVSGQLFISMTHQKVLQALRQADYLSPKYHVVIANPPYMGSGGMNGRLGSWSKDNYPDEKSDLFAMFMERSLALALKQGMTAMINMQAWMFLSSFEVLRTKLLSRATLLSMAHIGERGFDSIGGAVVSTTAFVFSNSVIANKEGVYLRLVDGKSEAEKSSMALEAIRNPGCGWFFRSSANDFSRIPGHPIAYWASKSTIQAFESGARLGDDLDTAQGMKTLDNERFIRRWQEVSFSKITGSSVPDKQWVPINHGGGFRKWYGFQEAVLNWFNDGEEIKALAKKKYNSVTRTVTGMGHYFKSGITWSAISSDLISVRKFGDGFIFTNAGMCAFGNEISQNTAMALLNSKVGIEILKILAPSVNFGPNQISEIRIIDSVDRIQTIQANSGKLVGLSCRDWDSLETSWDFTAAPLLDTNYRQPSLKATYQKLRAHWREMTLEMQRLEEENNRIFIDAYGLQDELTPEVPLNEITLTCNPHYRYGNDKSEDELEALLLADTMGVGFLCRGLHVRPLRAGQAGADPGQPGRRD
jgi:type II restriction/modification system DNA methylase subunit YeeA